MYDVRTLVDDITVLSKSFYDQAKVADVYIICNFRTGSFAAC